MNFSAIILAGGKSQRMGHDKALLPVGGKPLLARQIQLVRELGATEIFISGRKGTDYSGFPFPVLTDRFEDAGPLAGIERGLAAISTPLLLVLAVDMPKMKAPQLQMLLAQCADNCGRIPRIHGCIEPLAAIYPRTALTLATELFENGRFAARLFAERCVELKLAVFVDLPDQHSGSFESWNTPADVSDADF